MPYIVTIPSPIDVIAVASAIVESVNAVLDIHRDTIEFDQAVYDLLSDGCDTCRGTGEIYEEGQPTGVHGGPAPCPDCRDGRLVDERTEAWISDGELVVDDSSYAVSRL